MGAQLYRMRIENTQFVDMATKWSLAWPKDSPPQLKPLPKQISTALQNRLDAGSIVAVKPAEITGDEIIGDDRPAREARVAGMKLTPDGELHPDHVASFQIDAKPQALPPEVAGSAAAEPPPAARPRPRSNAQSERRAAARPAGKRAPKQKAARPAAEPDGGGAG